MTTDASELLVPWARHFTIGFVIPDAPAPKVLGSGVLATIGNTSGILTCSHVADEYSGRSEIGLLGFSRDKIDQRQRLQLGATATIKLAEPPYDDPYEFDLAFTRIQEIDLGSLKARFSFLNLDGNWRKFTEEPDHDTHVDAIFGLVGERSEEPVREAGIVKTPMQGLLTPGRVVEWTNGIMTFECLETIVPEIPKSFGGNSGGGLWRAYLKTNADGSYECVGRRFCGLASFQADATHILCQGIERVEQALLPKIRELWS